MRKKSIRLIAMLLSFLMLISSLPITEMTVEAVTVPKLVKKSANIVIGETAKIKVKNVPKGAKITYKSVKKNIATVTKQGKVKGIKSGTTKIIVLIKKHSKITRLNYKVTVKKPKLSKSKLSLALGETVKLSVKNKPKTAKYTWISNNLKVATVTKNGMVEANMEGTATIKLKVKTEKKVYNLFCKATVSSSKQSYKVTFDSNGGSAVPSVLVNAGDTISAPDNPVKEGYIFVGWYTNSSFDEMFLFDFDKVNKDITVYADWIEDNEDAIAVAYTIPQINIGYQNGDNAENVTRDVTLPTEIEDVEGVHISWESSDPATLSIDGKVNRPKGSNRVVTLSAVISRGDISENKTFSLTVIHLNEREPATISNNSITDIQNMNEDDDFNILYSSDKTQVTSIEGRYSDIIVENADDALDVIQSVHTILGISNPYNELKINNIHSDKYGAEYSYKQYYNGYEIYGRSITVSVDKKGITDSLGSGLCKSSIIEMADIMPVISVRRAEELVLSKYGEGCSISKDTQLVIYSWDEYEEHPILTYLVGVSGVDKENEYISLGVFINAQNGETVSYYSNILDATEKTENGKTGSGEAENGETSSGEAENGEKVPFPVSPIIGFIYEMRDSERKIQMYESAEEPKPSKRILSINNYWKDKTAISAYTNVIKVYEWYDKKLERTSIDDNEMDIRVIVHATGDTDNAYWDGKCIKFFDNSIGYHYIKTYASCLDVAGHEFTHGVVQYVVTGDMNYAHNYLGAINEGYADIFGCLIEGNWLIGEDRVKVRDATNPEVCETPSILNGEYYLDPYDKSKCDNCKAGGDEHKDYINLVAHVDSSLLSHAAYLMSQYGIPNDTLAKLWYKSLYMHYDTRSDFHTVRRNVLKAAKKMELSKDEIENVKKAFDEEHIYGDSVNEEHHASGRITNPLEDEKPLEGVTVKFRKGFNNISGAYVQLEPDEDIELTTDSLGKYSTNELLAGEYTLEASKDGFITEFVNIVSGDPRACSNQDLSLLPLLGGHTYHRYDIGLTWEEAKEYCESLGGHLAVITSEEEQATIEKMLEEGTRNSYWIGGYENADGRWTWVTGEPFDYKNWTSLQPDDNKKSSKDGEDVLMIYKEPNPKGPRPKLGQWNDLYHDGTCGDEPFFGLDNFGFICEWEVPNH